MINKRIQAVTLFLPLLIILSCTPRATKIDLLNQDETGGIGDSYDGNDYPELPEEITPGGYVVEDPDQIILIADTMASNAEIYALHGDYEKAHTLFTISLELIDVLNRNEEVDGFSQADHLYNRIAEFYVDLLPPVYLDSVPSSLGSFVSKYQLDGLLMSMENGEIDTALIATLQCSESAIYNIPITYNERVQKALTAILRSGRKNWIEILLGRAHYYRPMMNERYEAAGIPTDITFLPILESAFDPKAYSPAHASGLWQFIPSTGRAYDMRANYWVDERRDPIKATDASIGYFTRLFGLFDDWYLALASYNCGEGRVRRTMNRMEVDNYWDLTLPRETMNYVPLYIAYQIVAKNPHCFGYEVDTTKKTYDLERVYVSDCIDLNKVAAALDMTFDSLKYMNPHIIKWCTPPNMDSVSLYIPQGTTEKYNAFYSSLSDADKVNWFRYKIQSGDVLGNIAGRFGVSLSALKQINNMRSNRIIAGRYIFVPIPANTSVEETLQNGTQRASSTSNLLKKTHEIRRGETLSTIAPEYDVTVDQICQWNGITNAALISVGQKLTIFVKGAEPEVVAVATPTGDKQYYTVQSGESLYTISLKLGVTVDEIAAWNGKSTDRPIIHPGERLAFYGSPTANRTEQVVQAAEVAASGTAQKYIVKSGESLYSISLKLGVTLNELAAWNDKDVSNPAIYPDEELTYYTAGSEPAAVESETNTSSSAQRVSEPTGEKHSYTVQSGESLYSISQKIGVSVADLVKWNDKDSDRPVIHPGEKLVYYGEKVEQSSGSESSSSSAESSTSSSSTLNYRVKAGDTMYAISQTFGISLNTLMEANGGSSSIHPGDLITIPVSGATPSQTGGSSAETISYRVNSGDNLWSIAGMFNVSVNEICTASNIDRTAQLQPGDVLQIPVKE